MNKSKELTNWLKLSNALLRIVRRSYIYYENVNPMWNDGTIYVYVGGKAIKMIFVNDDDNPYDIIDKLKQKYKIKRVKEKHNWR